MKVRTAKQLAILALILAPLDLAGQDFWGPLLPLGQMRLEAHSLFLFADERFGRRVEGGSLVEKDEPLGFDFTDTAVGSRLFPGLESLETNLATATGTAVTPLVLGRTQATLTTDAVWVPIRLDLGVLDWLTIGVTVPLSRRRAEFETSFQGNVANVGLTSSTYGDFLGSVSTANTDLSGVVATLCAADPSSSECASATSLLADGQGFYDALSDTDNPQGLFPLEGSATGDALDTRVTSLMSAYQTAGVLSFPSSIPLATDTLTEATYLDLVRSPAFGVEGDSLRTWRSPWRVGDVELHAHARLWTTGQEIPPDEPQPTVRMEVGAGALVRIGSGQTDSPRNFIDTGSGDGQLDIELRVFGTLSVGDRLGLVGDLRYGIQRPGQVLRRVTAPDRIFAPRSTEEIVRWNPGDYTQLRVSPRVHLTDEIAFALDFRYVSKKADRYRTTEAGSVLDPGLLELETRERALGVGGGFVFSTVRSGRGRPLEARFLFQRAASGSGGATPKTTRFEVGVRFYRGLWD